VPDGNSNDVNDGKNVSEQKTKYRHYVRRCYLIWISIDRFKNTNPIGDVQYMKAMIPHHSSAILVSKNANLKDPEVIKLSEGIIASQEKEIAEMKATLARIGK
jgi:uncharacterized protein (DUF305 family)